MKKSFWWKCLILDVSKNIWSGWLEMQAKISLCCKFYKASSQEVTEVWKLKLNQALAEVIKLHLILTILATS